MRGKYSPTVSYSYRKDQEWHGKHSNALHDTYDKDGYDSYGYDANDKDRAGYREEDYYCLDDEDTGGDRYEDVYSRFLSCPPQDKES